MSEERCGYCYSIIESHDICCYQQKIDQQQAEIERLREYMYRLYKNHGHGTFDEACDVWHEIDCIVGIKKLRGEDDESDHKERN